VASETYIHAIPLWLLREYLEELGGQAINDNVVRGDGWQAELAKLPDFQLGSLRVGRVELRIEGETGALASLKSGLDLKTLRGGG
jgi:hypothetical protein